jgi:hypothetical protein
MNTPLESTRPQTHKLLGLNRDSKATSRMWTDCVRIMVRVGRHPAIRTLPGRPLVGMKPLVNLSR